MGNLAALVEQMAGQLLDHHMEPPFVLIAHEDYAELDDMPARTLEFFAVVTREHGELIIIKAIKDSRLITRTILGSPATVQLTTETVYQSMLAELGDG